MTYSYQPQKLVEQFRIFKETLEKKSETTSPVDNSNTTVERKPAGNSFVVASIQFTASGFPSSSVAEFWTTVENSIQTAAEMGAELILVPELFLGPYFCQSREACLMDMAWENVEECLLVRQMQVLARKYGVVLPVSLFERDNNALFNTVVMLDDDGKVLGKYRKSHIPDGTGYQEKFYFSPGDTGFKVWDTRVGKVGVAICWDQWFPEAARAMALQGADVLLHPTAIGSEPQDSTIDSSDHWQRAMQGHAAANVSMGVGAADWTRSPQVCLIIFCHHHGSRWFPWWRATDKERRSCWTKPAKKSSESPFMGDPSLPTKPANLSHMRMCRTRRMNPSRS